MNALAEWSAAESSHADAAITEAGRIAEQRAISGGADAATLQVVEVVDLPLAYLPGNSLRVRVRVAGDTSDRAG